MKAMVLCAGLGTRLRPLTQRWPKPAIPLLGPPLFRYTATLLQMAGVISVGINTHHLPELMREIATKECMRLGLALTSSHEPEIQGTGGAIRGMRTFLEDSDPFVLFNGDILFALDLAKAVEAHKKSGAIGTLVLLPMPLGTSYNAVELNEGMEVRRLANLGPGPASGEKLSPWHFTGVHVLSPRIFKYVSPTGVEDSVRDIYPRALAAGEKIHGHVSSGYWSDLGTPSRYLATVRDLLRGDVPLDRFPNTSPLSAAKRLSHGAFSFQDLVIPPGVSVSGPALWDAGAVLEPGVKLGESVYIGAGSHVGAGARLNRVVVFEGTEIAPGENLVETLAWEKERISAPLELLPA